MGRLTVLAPGQWTTLQAPARRGVAHLGITPGGAADPLSHRVANGLVGNDDDAATLECTLVGPKVHFDCAVELAICGADLGARVDGCEVPRWRRVSLRPDSVLEFGRPAHGARAYVAIAGGIDVPVVLGSRATDRVAGIGGWHGRELRSGDVLPIHAAPSIPEFASAAFVASSRIAVWAREFELVKTPVLRVVPRARAEVDVDRQHAFVGREFTVGPRSDRMGVRLAGPAIVGPALAERVSSPVTAGTIQLPPDGNPIVLLADHQTTGGYPVLGELASVELPRAAQLRPGDRVRFAWIGVGDAQAHALARETDLARMRAALRGRIA